ncbi:hypothetical protein [Paractinoplanes rishiriensis]|uniref:Uncharacterized protein n=1 Tax=Paractinoplanes rishiriensis TaxID=1050105 RepID=A0A919K620_9ACTN|nr:hypothetical protein [Actinoplanes rishiriensis]GIF01551.1 hypothetical protein Ari01nite_90150 [Actinoplanes rishiriensis]
MIPTVNVLYIRGVVTALARFAPLLVEHTGWRYRLVANGCTPDEVALLQHIAATSDRLTVHDLHAPEVLPHGTALCRLADTFTGEPFFAFMDSDIAVTGDITATLGPALETHEAVFTGTPIWALPHDLILTDAHTEVCGPHHYSGDGLLLGNSYMAIYHRAAFDAVARHCEATVDKYTRAGLDGLDPGFRAFLTEHHLVRKDYTPPKILTLGFAYTGRPTTAIDCPDLHHIGGFSLATYQQQVTDGTTRATPAAAAEILGFTDARDHMDRKLAVCQRVTRSFAAIDATGQPCREITLPGQVEHRVRLLEELYATHAPVVARPLNKVQQP